MQITLNGHPRECPDGVTVLGLLEALGLDPSRVAIELDGDILKRPEWPGRALSPGAHVEIVHFVGGG